MAVGWILVAAPAGAAQRARNVILFLGDAGGIPTINAAAIVANRPAQLFIQRMPHIGLMETSSATEWVTDSAAGMTAIVTGRKTVNGVLSQDATAVPGTKDGAPLETILEQAEKRGLSTGVISNDSILGATPAACYAHVNTRKNLGEILAQLFKPRAGDGVDVVIGSGRSAVLDAARERGLDVDAAAQAGGYRVASDLHPVPETTARLLVMLSDREFDLGRAVELAASILARNPKGYFLMVECDLHPNDIEHAIRRTLKLDALIQRTAKWADPKDTLVVFTADHSFDLRVRGGKKGQPILGTPALRMDDTHTGEEVLVAARGPGAELVRGFIANTELYRVMRRAYGWGAEPTGKPVSQGPARPAASSTPAPTLSAPPKPTVSPTPKPTLSPTPRPTISPTPKRRGRPCVWPKPCEEEGKEEEKDKDKPQEKEKWPPQPALPGR